MQIARLYVKNHAQRVA